MPVRTPRRPPLRNLSGRHSTAANPRSLDEEADFAWRENIGGTMS
jgi:hypothetical protein